MRWFTNLLEKARLEYSTQLEGSQCAVVPELSFYSCEGLGDADAADPNHNISARLVSCCHCVRASLLIEFLMFVIAGASDVCNEASRAVSGGPGRRGATSSLQ